MYPTFFADNGLSLVIELNDGRNMSGEQAAGLATYSNSDSTVLSNASIFKTLWLSQSSLPIPTSKYSPSVLFRFKDERRNCVCISGRALILVTRICMGTNKQNIVRKC